jgi:hypothetical protein
MIPNEFLIRYKAKLTVKAHFMALFVARGRLLNLVVDMFSCVFEKKKGRSEFRREER